MQSCRFQHTLLCQLHITWVVLLDFFLYCWWLVQIAASSMSRFLFFFSFPKQSTNILQYSSQLIFKSAISNSCSCFSFWCRPQVSFYVPFFTSWALARGANFCSKISPIFCKTGFFSGYFYRVNLIPPFSYLNWIWMSFAYGTSWVYLFSISWSAVNCFPCLFTQIG